MDEAKRWPHTPYSQLQLTDKYQNVIAFRSLIKGLTARFTYGENLLASLPIDYRTYDIQMVNESVVTAADIEAIAQWKSASRIRIVDGNGVSLGLVERANKLK